MAAFLPAIDEAIDIMDGRSVSNGLNPLQNAMIKVGLTTPIERGVALAASTIGILYAVQPSFAFDRIGARPFAGTNKSKSATWAHPVALGVAAGVAGAVFL